MRKSAIGGAIVIGMLMATGAVLDCGNKAKTTGGQLESRGTVGLQLQVGDVTVDTVHYVLTNGSVTMSGDIQVASATTLTAVIGGVPEGTNYTLTLSATERGDAGATCTGVSQPFTVTANTTANVGIVLTCRRPRQSGSVLVNSTTNECPTITSVSADAPVGNTIALHVAATDPDHGPHALTTTWSGGSFSDIHSSNPTLTCSAPGVTTLTVTVSDGDTAPNCDHSFTLIVGCPANGGPTGTGGSAGAGGSAGTGGAGTGGAGTGGAGTGGAGTGGAGTGGAGTGGAGTGGAGTGGAGTGGAGTGGAGTGGAGTGGAGTGGAGTGGAGTGGAGTGGAGTGGSPVVDAAPPPAPCDSDTVSCLQSRDQTPGSCYQCAVDQGCFDATFGGHVCEDVATPATACQTVIGGSSVPSEKQICLATLSGIFSSHCAAGMQINPCLCGTTAPDACLNGTGTPNGALYPLYQCDLGPSIGQINNNILSPSLGAGVANAIIQCVQSFQCGCAY